MQHTPPPPARSAEIAIAGASLAYGAHRVLDGLSLSVAAGEIYALLGGNAGTIATITT